MATNGLATSASSRVRIPTTSHNPVTTDRCSCSKPFSNDEKLLLSDTGTALARPTAPAAALSTLRQNAASSNGWNPLCRPVTAHSTHNGASSRVRQSREPSSGSISHYSFGSALVLITIRCGPGPAQRPDSRAGSAVIVRCHAGFEGRRYPMSTETKVSEHRRRPGAEERSEPGVDQ